jgi:hypothetical protein
MFEINLKPYLGFDSYYNLSQKDFNKLSHKLLSRIDELLSEILEKYKDIEFFILVGGSSKMKILQEKIYDITRKKPWIHPNLESVVSEGAALYSAIITNNFKTKEEVLLVDVLPLSLGVETADGNFSVIIPKDTPLPAKRTQKYTTDAPGDNLIKVKIYQGERKIANKNVFIGEVEFDKVSITGMPVIDVTFKVDLNGIINISILDKKSGIDKNIIIKDIPQYNEDALRNIIKEAEVNNDADSELNTKLQRIYIIKTNIENGLINLNINELLKDDTKNEIRRELNDIEESLESKSNHELLEIIKNMEEKFSGLIQTLEINDNDNTQENKMDELEKMMINELKVDIIRRANLLLIQNPEWGEFLNPLLEELQITNLTHEYLEEKLILLKEVQGEDTDERDYKEELKNLCIYLNNELQEDQLDISDDNKKLLGEKLKLLFNLFETDEENKIDWEDKLKDFNEFCESLYN